jgi:PadR family transcriptional regulator, regulatory protein AphA
MARRTATTANALLGLLALRREWSTWDLTQQLRRNMGFFWPRAESQIYGEAKSLVAKGFATAKESYTGRRRRTVYRISAKGSRALKEWLASPPRPTSLECEPLLRVFLADFSTREQLQAALDQLRADADAIFDVGRVVGAEYLDGTAPFQDQVHVRALVFDFLSHHALMLRQWTDRAEEVFDSWEGADLDRVETALQLIRSDLMAFPPSRTGAIVGQ